MGNFILADICQDGRPMEIPAEHGNGYSITVVAPSEISLHGLLGTLVCPRFDQSFENFMGGHVACNVQR